MLYRTRNGVNGKTRKTLNTGPRRPNSAVIPNTDDEVKEKNVKSSSSRFFGTSKVGPDLSAMMANTGHRGHMCPHHTRARASGAGKFVPETSEKHSGVLYFYLCRSLISHHACTSLPQAKPKDLHNIQLHMLERPRLPTTRTPALSTHMADWRANTVFHASVCAVRVTLSPVLK